MKKILGLLAILGLVTMFVGCKGTTDSGTPTPTSYSITMKAITGCTFSMGSLDGVGDSDEKPQHDVTLSDFYMGETEVTQGQWETVMGDTWPGASDSKVPSSDYGLGDNYPAYYISWYDAVEFCNALSVKEGLTPVYAIDEENDDPNNTSSYDNIKWTVTADFTKNGYRLPTEAEWEYAAGGGNGTRTTYAGTDSEDDLGDYAWYDENNSPSGTKEVKTRNPNGLGLYDMSGNVYEWCWDWYDSYGETAQTDPKGPDSGSYRVFRGGSWLSYAYSCRVAFRNSYDADNRDSYIGFRLARSCSL